MQNQESEFIKFLAYITALNKIVKKAIETHKGSETIENKRAKFTYIIN